MEGCVHEVLGSSLVPRSSDNTSERRLARQYTATAAISRARPRCFVWQLTNLADFSGGLRASA